MFGRRLAAVVSRFPRSYFSRCFRLYNCTNASEPWLISHLWFMWYMCHFFRHKGRNHHAKMGPCDHPSGEGRGGWAARGKIKLVLTSVQGNQNQGTTLDAYYGARGGGTNWPQRLAPFSILVFFWKALYSDDYIHTHIYNHRK